MVDTLFFRRTVLRPVTPEDIPAIVAMNADARVMAHFPHTLNAAESEAFVRRILAHYTSHGFGLLAVSLPGITTFAGLCGLSVPNFVPPFGPCVEIGWRMAPEFWGRGIATEAARACLTYGFRSLGLQEVVSFTATSNARSLALMERIGLLPAKERSFEHPRIPEGSPLRPHVVYALARDRFFVDIRTPVSTQGALGVARAFARALDGDNFESARPLVAEDCVYQVRGRTLVGPLAILGSYAEATRGAHARFDEVRYESDVSATGNTATIHYTDILSVGGRTHLHRCEQELEIRPDGRISVIVHRDLPEERERLASFLAECDTAPASTTP